MGRSRPARVAVCSSKQALCCVCWHVWNRWRREKEKKMTQKWVIATHFCPPPPADTHQVEDGLSNSTLSMKSIQSGGLADPRQPLHNKLIQKDQNRKTQSYKVESVSRRTIMDVQNFSLENKRESEYVSQRSNQASAAHQTLVLFSFFFGGRLQVKFYKL